MPAAQRLCLSGLLAGTELCGAADGGGEHGPVCRAVPPPGCMAVAAPSVGGRTFGAKLCPLSVWRRGMKDGAKGIMQKSDEGNAKPGEMLYNE